MAPAYLKELGCDLVQGFHVSRPLVPDHCLGWMDEFEQQFAADQTGPASRPRRVPEPRAA